MNRTELSTLGEFGLIKKLQSSINIRNKHTLSGIGDDAAVIQPPAEKVLLLSTDMLVEGIHFDLAYTPLPHLGYKMVACNVSDICAMNGIPAQVTVSIALSNRFSLEAIEALYEGMEAACQAYGIDLVGGDTTASPKGLVVSIAITGFANKSQLTYRNAGRVGDILCVTGDLGAAYAGLQLLRREKQVLESDPTMQPELDEKNYVIGRQLKPEARLDIIHEFNELGLQPHAMIDISDGLASELLHICTQSGVGAYVYEDKLPLDQQTLETISEFNLSSTACALNGGEDYELLFSIAQSDYEKIKNHPDITTIGYLTEAEKGIKLITTGDTVVDIKAQGWVHF